MAQTQSKLREYPKYQAFRGGCKVNWYWYEKKEDAEAASEVAKHNARICEERGYDFGYQTPGQITEVGGGFEVTIP